MGKALFCFHLLQLVWIRDFGPLGQVMSSEAAYSMWGKTPTATLGLHFCFKATLLLWDRLLAAPDTCVQSALSSAVKDARQWEIRPFVQKKEKRLTPYRWGRHKIKDLYRRQNQNMPSKWKERNPHPSLISWRFLSLHVLSFSSLI